MTWVNKGTVKGPQGPPGDVDSNSYFRAIFSFTPQHRPYTASSQWVDIEYSSYQTNTSSGLTYNTRVGSSGPYSGIKTSVDGIYLISFTIRTTGNTATLGTNLQLGLSLSSSNVPTVSNIYETATEPNKQAAAMFLSINRFGPGDTIRPLFRSLRDTDIMTQNSELTIQRLCVL